MPITKCIILSLMLTILIFSGETTLLAKEQRSLSERIALVKSYCFKKIWDINSCEIGDLEQHNTQEIESRLDPKGVVPFLIDGGEAFYSTLTDWYDYSNRLLANDSDIFNIFKEDLRTFQRQYPLTSCQSTCLALCSNRLLINTFDIDAFRYLKSTETCLRDGKGLCFSYSRMFQDLAQTLGLKTKKMSTWIPGAMPHSFVKVLLEDNNWYYINPTDKVKDNRCFFYQPPNSPSKIQPGEHLEVHPEIYQQQIDNLALTHPDITLTPNKTPLDILKKTEKDEKRIHVLGASVNVINSEEKLQHKNSHLEIDGFLVTIGPIQMSADSKQKGDIRTFQLHKTGNGNVLIFNSNDEMIHSSIPISLEAAIDKLISQ